MIVTKEKWTQYLAIILIALSTVGLVVTPSTMRWFIVLEGISGIAGIVLFVYTRIQFWRKVKKSLKYIPSVKIDDPEV